MPSTHLYQSASEVHIAIRDFMADFNAMMSMHNKALADYNIAMSNYIASANDDTVVRVHPGDPPALEKESFTTDAISVAPGIDIAKARECAEFGTLFVRMQHAESACECNTTLLTCGFLALSHTMDVVQRSVDGIDDDGLVPLNSKVFARLRASGHHSFVIPFQKSWGFKIATRVHYPTALKINPAVPNTVWVMYGTLLKFKAASTWSKLVKHGKWWKGRLPIGPRGGTAAVKLDNGYFPTVAIRSTRYIHPDKVPDVTAIEIACNYYSGPGCGLEYIKHTSNPVRVDVAQSLDAKTIYRIYRWIDQHGKQYNVAYTTESYRHSVVATDEAGPYLSKNSLEPCTDIHHLVK